MLPFWLLHGIGQLLLRFSREFTKAQAHPPGEIDKFFGAPLYALCVCVWKAVRVRLQLSQRTASSSFSRSLRLKLPTQSMKHRSTTVLYMRRLCDGVAMVAGHLLGDVIDTCP